jgi:2,4-dienoyl-CoA reductase-like NADH-dependent reductase (Old Yellow Enzyme family)/thioredoxin reductase
MPALESALGNTVTELRMVNTTDSTRSSDAASRYSSDMLISKPFRLGNVVLKNRFLMPAIGTEYADRGYVTERMIRYYERRAEGGVGLIQVEFCAVAANGASNHNQVRIDHDDFVPGLSELVRRVHVYDVPIVLQLAHAGRQMSVKMSGNQPVAPSAVPCPLIKDMPRALTTAEVKLVIEQFVEGARRAKRAGFVGVQLHGAHGYLFHQFVSPLSNFRTDEYGGSWENRVRFPLEVVQKIREEVGQRFLIGYKISAKEYFEDGLNLDDSTALAQLLQDVGLDYLEVSSGTYAHMQHMVQPMLFERGYLVPFAAHMKRRLRIPVVAVGRINNPETAETVLRNGDADIVAVGRGLLADPDFPRKALKGQWEDIRQCVACNECMSLAFRQRDVACLINPELSREGTIDMSPTSDPKVVLVVGGGPGGVQAALSASAKGHRVILCDRGSNLGGKLPIVGLPPGKNEYYSYLQFLSTQVRKSTIQLMMNTNVDLEFAQGIAPDIVIVATGARAQVPTLPGGNAAHVCTADEALLGFELGHRIIILGASGTGCETAQYLRKEGHDVTMIARSQKAARSIEPITRQVLLEEVRTAGIKIAFGFDCSEIGSDAVVCRDEGGNTVEFPCDGVVIARGYLPESDLAQELEKHGFQVMVIGDAVEPRKILEAVTEAHLVAVGL